MEVSILFWMIAIVQAASLFPNSTTSTSGSTSSTMTTTSMSTACPSTGLDSSYRDCRRPDDPGYFYISQIVNLNPYNTTKYPYDIYPPNATIADFCSSDWSSALEAFFATAPIKNEGISYSSTTLYEYAESFSYTTSKPCCLNCTIFGGTVQVYYWPTSTASPPVSTLVDKSNFTFISPSIYVAFQSLYAKDSCGSLGPTYNSTTLAFDPGLLSTMPAWSIDGGNDPLPPEYVDLYFPTSLDSYTQETYKVASFAQDLPSCTSWSTTFDVYLDTVPTFFPDADGNRLTYTNAFTYDECSPSIAVPTKVYSINPEWKFCGPGIDGFYDPPYFLQPGSGMSAFSAATTPATVETESSPAAPVNLPTNSNPTTTSVPTSAPSQVAVGPSEASQGADPTTAKSTEGPKDSSSDPPQDPATQTHSPSPDAPTADPSPTTDDPPTSNDPTITSSTKMNNDPPPIQSTTQDPDPQSTSSSPADKGSPGILTATLNNDPSPTQSHSNNLPLTLPTILSTGNLSPGGPATTISGTTYSLPSSGSGIVIDGTTAVFPVSSPSAQYIVGSHTLMPGAVITELGTVYSRPSSGSGLIIDGTTTVFPESSSPPEYIVGSQTLAPGAEITEFSTTISLESNGATVVIDGTTEPLSSLLSTEMVGGTETTVWNLGGVIVSMGGFTTPVTSGSLSTTTYLQVGGTAGNGTVYSGGRREDISLRNLGVVLCGAVLGVAFM